MERVEKQPPTKKARRIFGYLKPYLGLEAIIGFLMIILSVLPLLGPLVLKILIDEVLVNGDQTLLNILIVALISLFLLNGLIFLLTVYIYTFVGQRVLFDIRFSLFRHLEQLHLGFFTSTKIGEIISRVNNDVGTLQSVMTTTFVSMVRDLVTLGAILVLIVYLDWQLTLVSLILFPFVFISQVYFGKQIKTRSRRTREKSADVLSFFQETLSGIRIVQSFVREKFEASRLVRKSRELIHLRIDLGMWSAYAGGLAGFLAAASPVICLWYGGHKVIAGELTIGGMVAFYAYVGQLFGPVSRLAQHNVSIQTAMASIDRIFEYLDIRPGIRDQSEAVPLPTVQGRITFQDVCFAYEANEPVLTDLSFEAAPGQMIAIVGRSGAGKSTVINLLCRFYDPQSGAILIDNHDLRTVQLRTLRRQIGLVSQETMLFNTTIADNIRYGNTKARHDDIVAAARKANIHGYIEGLPDQYETVVGDRGVRLSGGQRQRVSIARTILKDPRILIFDEATSSLDTESENLIQQAIEPLMRDRTSIVIAHRLSTVMNADAILVLDRGRLVEQGRHPDLLSRGGLYRQLSDEMARKSVSAPVADHSRP